MQTQEQPSRQELINNDATILLKSKKVLDKLSYKISQVAKKTNERFLMDEINKKTKKIQHRIESQIETNFNEILNSQVRLGLCMLPQKQHVKRVEEGSYNLMSKYWKEKMKEPFHKKVPVSFKNKENYKKIPHPFESQDISILKPHKNHQQTSIKRNKEERLLAKLYSYMIPIIDYKVENDSSEFLLFQKNHYNDWDQIDQIINAIENFCQFYEIRSCILDLQKMVQLIKFKRELKQKNKNKSKSKQKNKNKENQNTFTPHQLLGCLENPEKISEKNFKKPGIRYYGNKGKIRAIIKIQSCMRGKIVFKRVNKLKELVKKVIKIQRAYQNYRLYLKTKDKIREREFEKWSWFKQSQKKFQSHYKVNELVKKIKYQIHISCHSMNEWQRVSTLKYSEGENTEINRIFRIAKNSSGETRIIFISSTPIPRQVLRYYYRLFEVGDVEDYKKKLYILSPERESKSLPQTLSLTRLLYYSPSLLDKIKGIVGGGYAYIVPSIPSIDFIPLSYELKIPLFASNPQTLLYLQSKSGVKQLSQVLNGVQDSKFGVLPYATDIYSANSLINELALLICKYPNIHRWVLKIDNQIESRGMGFLDISKIIPGKVLYRLKTQTTERAQIEQIYKYLHENFIKREAQQLCIARSIYQNQSQFLNNFYIHGGVVEAAINNFEGELENLCFCIEIDPTGEWKEIGNYFKLTVKKRKVGCFYDSEEIKPPQQLEILIKQLLKRKCYGYFTFEFMRIPSDSSSSESHLLYFNDVKCHLDALGSASYLRKFISGGSNVLYIPLIHHPNLQKIKIQTFFHLCRLENISFDQEKMVGNIFMFVDGLESGCMGLMTFNSEGRVETFVHAAEVMNFLKRKVVQGDSNEEVLLIRNCINGYLNTIRRNHQKKKKLDKYE